MVVIGRNPWRLRIQLAHEPRSVLLTLIAGGPPEGHRALLILGDDRGESARALLAQTPLALPEQHRCEPFAPKLRRDRSEEHTSELQSLRYLVCRLLLV